MTTSIVTLTNTNAYTIWGTLAAADLYLGGLSTYAARWAAADADDRKRALYEATEYLSELSWREGITPSDNESVMKATYILAACLIIDPTIIGGAGGGSVLQGAVRMVKDTTRTVEFHYDQRSAKARTNATNSLPRDVLSKIRPYLLRSATGDVALPRATGTSEESAFTSDKLFDLSD